MNKDRREILVITGDIMRRASRVPRAIRSHVSFLLPVLVTFSSAKDLEFRYSPYDVGRLCADEVFDEAGWVDVKEAARLRTEQTYSIIGRLTDLMPIEPRLYIQYESMFVEPYALAHRAFFSST